MRGKNGEKVPEAAITAAPTFLSEFPQELFSANSLEDFFFPIYSEREIRNSTGVGGGVSLTSCSCFLRSLSATCSWMAP